MAVKKENTAKNKIYWFAGGVIVLIILVFIIFKITGYISNHSAGKYETSLSSYFKAVSRSDTNDMMRFMSQGFTTELTNLQLQPGRYILFSYHFEDLSLSTTNTTNFDSTAKITFSITTTESREKISYLAAAYFVLDKDEAKLRTIKNIYRGKDITR